MRKSVNRMLLVSLVQASLVVGPLSISCPWAVPAYAAERDRDRRESAADSIGLAESRGEMTIDGRPVLGPQVLREGGSVRAGREQTRLLVRGIGEMVLGTESELSVDQVRLQGETGTLLGSLRQGRATFRLANGSTALIRTKQQSFLASPGSVFQLQVASTGADLEIASGAVQPVGNWGVELPRRTASPPALPLEERASGEARYRITPLGGKNQARVRALSEQELKFRVTDGTDQPLSRIPVSFQLEAEGNPDAGALGKGRILAQKMTVLTDEQGIATVPFLAGRHPGAITLHATINGEAGEMAEHDQRLEVTGGRFWTKKNAIPVLATVGAIAVIAILVTGGRPDPSPIQPSGGVQIIP